LGVTRLGRGRAGVLRIEPAKASRPWRAFIADAVATMPVAESGLSLPLAVPYLPLRLAGIGQKQPLGRVNETRGDSLI